MENYVAVQLADLGASVVLGCLAAVVYDLLRTIRMWRKENRALTDVVDGAYVLLLLLALLWFCLRRGHGELRIFMICGIVSGAGLYFLLAAKTVRPILDFWVHAIVAFGKILWQPIVIICSVMKKIGRQIKKYFHFIRKYATIRKYKWEFILIHRKSGVQGGKNGKKKSKKSAHKSHYHSGGHHSGRAGERGGSQSV